MLTLPDLRQLFAVQEWVQEHTRQGVEPDVLITSLANVEQPLAWLRAADLLREQNRSDPRGDELISSVYAQGNHYEKMLALIAEQHGKLLRVLPTPRIIAREVEAALLSLADEIQNLSPHPLRLETEWRYMRALRSTYFALEDSDQMHRWSARLLMLAEVSRNPAMLREAQRVRMADLNRSNEFSRMAAMQLPGDDLSVLPSYTLETFRPLIIGLTNLAAFPKIDQLIANAPEHLQTHDAIHAYQTWTHLYAGDLTFPDVPDVQFLDKYQWQIEALHLAGNQDTEFPSPTAQQRRREAWQRVLDLSSEQRVENTLTVDVLFNSWLRGRMHLALGRYDLASHEQRHLPVASREMLADRALIAALKLDIAMSPALLEETWVQEASQELRAVFRDARAIPFADTDTLRKLVLRWHPQVAAYAALMDDPIVEFSPIVENVIVAMERTTWRGKRVPPTVYPYLTRLALRLPTMPLHLTGNALAQLRRIGQDERFDLPLWGPLLTALPLALCALRHEPGRTHKVAEILNTFGSGGLEQDAQLLELRQTFQKREVAVDEVVALLRQS